MSKYYIEMDFAITGHESTEELESLLDDVLDALYEDSRAIDPDYGATLATSKAMFSLSVEARSEPRALELALGIMRAAIHAAEGSTPGWEAHFEKIQTLISAVEAAELEPA